MLAIFSKTRGSSSNTTNQTLDLRR
jgi:hypothetical protein